MTTQIERLTSALRDLPYDQMMSVAKALGNRLGDSRSDAVIKLADALSALRGDFIDEGHEKVAEDTALRDMLGTRRRGFTVRVNKLPKGWSVFPEELNGGAVQSPDLRTALQAMIDHLVVTHIMLK